MASSLHEERCWWRALLAELVATALLVWFGLAAGAPAGGAAQPLAHVAWAFGAVVAANAAAFGPASGAHMNPAVTLAAVVAGRLRALPALGYLVAQCVGAALGYCALATTLPCAWPHGLTRVAPDVGVWGALATEGALTALLALACCALWAAPAPDPAAELKLGLLIVGLIYAGGPATGASLNPARSLAPAIWHNSWEHQWVYWVGPLFGGAVAAALHRWVLAAPAPRPRAPLALEEMPLDDKP